MKLTMVHNESVATFSQLSHHLELEEERYGFQTNPSVYVIESSQYGRSSFKPKRHDKTHNLKKLKKMVLTRESKRGRQLNPK